MISIDLIVEFDYLVIPNLISLFNSKDKLLSVVSYVKGFPNTKIAFTESFVVKQNTDRKFCQRKLSLSITKLRKTKNLDLAYLILGVDLGSVTSLNELLDSGGSVKLVVNKTNEYDEDQYEIPLTNLPLLARAKHNCFNVGTLLFHEVDDTDEVDNYKLRNLVAITDDICIKDLYDKLNCIYFRPCLSISTDNKDNYLEVLHEELKFVKTIRNSDLLSETFISVFKLIKPYSDKKILVTADQPLYKTIISRDGLTVDHVASIQLDNLSESVRVLVNHCKCQEMNMLTLQKAINELAQNQELAIYQSQTVFQLAEKVDAFKKILYNLVDSVSARQAHLNELLEMAAIDT